MPFEMDVTRNTIKVELLLDGYTPEEAADRLITVMRNHGQRSFLKQGGAVRLKHIEASRDLFDNIVALQRIFPAFRAVGFRALRSRGLLGTLCGATVVENNELGYHIKFRYTDRPAPRDDGFLDPMMIRPPKPGVFYLPEAG